MTKSIPKVILSAALFFGSVLACMELWARIDDFFRYGAPIFSDYSQESMLVVRNSTGISGKPNGRFEKWKLNANGFRGPEIPAEKPEHVLRVATMGASETFGIFESEGMEWPRQLEAGLVRAFPGRPIEVINTAFPGMGLESALNYFERRVRPLQVDMVLLYVNPLPFLDWPKPVVGAPPGYSRAGGEPKSSAGFNPGRPRLVSRFFQAWRTRGPTAIVAYSEENRAKRNYLTFDRQGQNAHLDSTQALAFKNELNELADTFRKAGIVFILSEHAHALMVWDPETHPAGWLNVWKYRPGISENVFREGYPALNAIFRQVGEKKGNPVAGQGILLLEPDSNFASDGIHFTDKGANLAAGNFLKVLLPIVKARFDSADSADM